MKKILLVCVMAVFFVTFALSTHAGQAAQHVNFTIHIPAVKPLYMKSNSKTIIFSGGNLSVTDGFTILSYP